MTVQSVSRDFGDEIPASVRAEAFVEEAKRVLYTFGVTPEEYKDYFSKEYVKSANQEGKERENQSTFKATDL